MSASTGSPIAAGRGLLARRSFFEWWIIGLFAFGVAARASYYLSPFGVPDSDEAVGGLMAQDALRGRLTAFMWGQA